MTNKSIIGENTNEVIFSWNFLEEWHKAIEFLIENVLKVNKSKMQILFQLVKFIPSIMFESSTKFQITKSIVM